MNREIYPRAALLLDTADVLAKRGDVEALRVLLQTAVDAIASNTERSEALDMLISEARERV